MHSPFFSFATLVGLIALVSIRPAPAQCDPQWQPGDGMPGVDGPVFAMQCWDRDGVGPEHPQLVVGGWFRTAGTVPCNGIAAFDLVTQTWSAFGGGMLLSNGSLGTVYSLAALPNGDLVAAGTFAVAGSTLVTNIARWDGTTWSPLGSGIFPRVNALAVMPNGDLIAGGPLFVTGGAPNCVARFDGTSWSPLGAGIDGVTSRVSALAVLPGGDLVAAGSFASAGGVGANGIARWNGSTWSAFGAGFGPNSGEITALAVRPGGGLLAGGLFATADGAPAANIAEWNGSAWSPLGSGTNGRVAGLAIAVNGDVFAGGTFTSAGGLAASGVARWNGAAWSTLGPGVGGSALAMTQLPGGELVVGGVFSRVVGPSAIVGVNNLAQWNGSAWSRIGSGLNGSVFAATALPDGRVVVGGEFLSAGGGEAFAIAAWNAGSWSPLGYGMNDTVRAVTTLPNGDVIAGGLFTTAGGAAANRIARWNGSSWSPFGSGLDGPVYALAVLPNGDVVAGGNFTSAGGVAASNIARWNGSAWSAMGSGIGTSLSSWVSSLCVMPDGKLVVGGSFANAGGLGVSGIARWDGTVWSSLSSPSFVDVRAMAVLPDGSLVAANNLSLGFASEVWRWGGNAWTKLGGYLQGATAALVVLPDGDIVAGGSFAFIDTALVPFVARWNGSAWSPVAGGPNGAVWALAWSPRGELFAGGEYAFCGNAASARFARCIAPCAATALPSGAGCPSSGGANTLAVQSAPWLGSTFRARGTGLPALALVSIVTGFSTLSLPLAAVLPQGQPGCDLLVSPDFVTFDIAVAGAVSTAIGIPDNVALIGVTFHQQLNPFEVDPNLNILAVTASNALSMVVGAF